MPGPRDVALAAIGAYQRYVSPHKGFCCAYRVHTGRAGCSALGARVIRRFGVWRGLQLLAQRLRRCGDVHRQCLNMASTRPPAAQRGDCDLGLPDASCCDAGDLCSCCSCDWPGRSSPKRSPRKSRRYGGSL